MHDNPKEKKEFIISLDSIDNGRNNKSTKTHKRKAHRGKYIDDDEEDTVLESSEGGLL
jgi:hypothetical protein